MAAGVADKESTERTIVVVGNGMVGHRFCEELAQAGAGAAFRVLVLAEEACPAYDRVQLSSYFADRNAAALALTDREWYADHDFALHLEDPVESIDREAKLVTTRSGRAIAYDELVLATGSRPFVPPIPACRVARRVRLPNDR